MMEHNARQGAVWRAEPRKNYGGRFLVKGVAQGCYTKKQMKSLYPNGNFQRVGEYGPGGKQRRTGSLHLDANRLPLYRFGAHSRLLYREKGFVAVGEDRYAALMQCVAVPRALTLLLCAVVITAGVIFLPGLLTAQPAGDAGMGQTSTLPSLEEGAVDWEGVRPQNTGSVASGIAIPGYKSITIAANQTDVKVNFYNPEDNPCYFVVSLVLGDGTVLYQSKMIEPGKALYDITLAQALAPGEYGAKVKYETYALPDLAPMNGAEVQIVLIAG